MGSIAEKLVYLENVKRQIGNALISRGQSVSDNDRFVDYSDKILNIETGADVYVSPITITENGDYDAGIGNAYNPVTVNITPDVMSKTIDENGEYNASDDGATGYSKVVVEVVPNLVEKTITEEGEYSAEDDNVDGYSKVTVALEIPEYCTVQFKHRETLLQVVNEVPYGGYAIYEGEDPTESGKIFTGWNPASTNIVRDTTCYATFEDEPANSDEEIQESWEDIIENRGANCPIGSFKTLLIGTVDGEQLRGVRMKKVAINERGTVSSWLAMDPLGYTTPVTKKMYDDDFSYTPENPRQDIEGWRNSDLREWLNNNLLSAMPHGLSGAIAQVTKFSRNIDREFDMIVNNLETQDRIWVPSGLEIGSASSLETMGVKYKDKVDSLGFTVSSFWTRSVVASTASGVSIMGGIGGGTSSVHRYNKWTDNGGTEHTSPNASSNVIIGFCL